MPTTPATYLITGIQAAGKSSVAQALATRVPGPSVHVHGEQFRRWIVQGRADMTPDPSPAALDQLRLRYRLAATACAGYREAGFTVVVQDVVLGPQLPHVVDLLRGDGPLHVVVLTPRPDVVADRERGRAKESYGLWTIEQLHRGLHGTPRIGLWLDTSDLTVEQTADEILRRPTETLVPAPAAGAGG